MNEGVKGIGGGVTYRFKGITTQSGRGSGSVSCSIQCWSMMMLGNGSGPVLSVTIDKHWMLPLLLDVGIP